jgi:glycosyltransferase involved in cell wall biosynthesis
MNTRNEAGNIGNAIRSVRTWVDEVIVMDMESEDGTVEIARSLGAKVFSYPKVINFDAARVAAVEHATCDWVLLLDADEVIPLELSRRLRRAAQAHEADAYAIPRLNYFSGEALLNAGWAPEQDRQLRFFRKGTVTLNDILHAHIAANPGVRVVNMEYGPDACIVHFNYRDSTQFVGKLNQYTSLTAFQRRNSNRAKDRSIVIVPVLEFLNRYFRKSGYRSGWRGFYYSFMMAAYTMTQAVKIREMQMGMDAEGSAERYQKIADAIIGNYEHELESAR